MTRLSMSLLGAFHAALDGEPIIRFRSDKARALLAYLMVEPNRPHSRHRLAGLLWPDYPERAALTNLRIELSNLCKVIGDRRAAMPFLEVARESVQFNCASDHWLDVAEFRAHTERGQHGPAPIQELASALSLYRGGFLEGFSLKDSPGFDDWSLLIRERLQSEALEACRRLAGHYERSGELERACEVARRAIELEPWEEEAHRRLMRLLALSGRRDEALRQYEVCRRQLAEELGVGPADETTALYEAIRSGSDGLDGLRIPAHNLPLPATPLVGREAELAGVADCLGNPDCRLLTLLGPGGSGKTRLALEAAGRQIDRYPDGVFFVPLESTHSASAMIGAIAQAIGVGASTGAGGQRDLRRQLLDYLRRKQMLLLLDGFEHLLDGGSAETLELLGQILGAAPRVKLLLTSRSRLNLADEYLLPVGGLEYPQPRDGAAPAGRTADFGNGGDGGAADPECAMEFGAVVLFAQAAARARPGYAPAPDDLHQVIRVCRLVQGMPLPILLAASWANVLSPAEIAEQLSEQGLDLLETGADQAPDRQRSMRATFDHSWRLLGERERAALMGLSAFRGGCTAQAAAQVAWASLRDLRALADRSLLQRGSSGRWEMHDLLREYATEQLARTADGGDAIRDRHAAYYAAAVEAWRDGLRGPRQGEVSAEMAPDVANLRAAWDRAAERRNIEWLDRILDGLCSFYERSTRFREGETACEAAAEALAALPGEGKRLLARVTTWQANFQWQAGRWEHAHTSFERSLDLLGRLRPTSLDVRAEEAFALLLLGRLRFHAGDREGSGDLCERSLALYRELDDRHGAAQALYWLGINAVETGHPDAAGKLLEESLAIYRSLGDQSRVADVLAYHIILKSNLGLLEEAEGIARECIAIAREARDQAAIAFALFELATVQLYEGDFAGAHELLGEVVALGEDLGLPDLMAGAEEVRIWMKVNLGDYAEARPLALANLARFREIGEPQGIGVQLLALGEIALAEENLTDALALLKESAGVLGEIGQRDEQALALAHLAHVYSLLGQPGQARTHLCQALQAALDTRQLPARIFSVASAAVCLAEEGAAEPAVELYALAARHPYIGNSRFWEDIAGKHIAAAAASLPPETVAAAQARGRARDLKATLEELLAEYA